VEPNPVSLDVAWQNRSDITVGAWNTVDPFAPEKNFSQKFKTNNVFSAILGLNPESIARLWADHEGDFTLSPEAAAAGHTPRTEFLKLLMQSIASELKLEVSTPIDTYLSESTATNKNTISYLWFRRYGYELFGETEPALTALYLPDTAATDLLNARFRGRMPGSADAVLAPSDGSVLV
jgi:hypothetical protein